MKELAEHHEWSAGASRLTRRAVLVAGLLGAAFPTSGSDARRLTVQRGMSVADIWIRPDGALAETCTRHFAYLLCGRMFGGAPADPALAPLMARFAEAAHWCEPLVVVAGVGANELAHLRLREDAAARALHRAGKAVDILMQHGEVSCLRAAALAVANTGGVGLNFRSRTVHIDTGPPRLWSRQLI